MSCKKIVNDLLDLPDKVELYSRQLYDPHFDNNLYYTIHYWSNGEVSYDYYNQESYAEFTALEYLNGILKKRDSLPLDKNSMEEFKSHFKYVRTYEL